jgi:hypothetical protein
VILIMLAEFTEKNEHVIVYFSPVIGKFISLQRGKGALVCKLFIFSKNNQTENRRGKKEK